jgi:NAD(P)-dependent dehydrogenase (short-subunit alcohol dehydrogenase family)
MSKTVVVTGASDGIGAAAARRLHRGGHRVLVVGRSPEKTRSVAAEIGAEHFVADFTDLRDVRKLAEEVLSVCPRIDVLANNAGGVFGDRTKTVDGFERTFQVNHLAPFLLTTLLLERLVESRATVIQTASVAARNAGVLDLDDLDHDRTFSAIQAYGAAKLENILFTRELHRRYQDRGLSAVAFHPGTVATGFGSTSSSRVIRFYLGNPLARATFVTPERGADQLVWLAEGDPGTDWEPGAYYVKRKVTTRVHPQAFDAEIARGLWDRSAQLVA